VTGFLQPKILSPSNVRTVNDDANRLTPVDAAVAVQVRREGAHEHFSDGHVLSRLSVFLQLLFAGH
jgi:hypothetical protein